MSRKDDKILSELKSITEITKVDCTKKNEYYLIYTPKVTILSYIETERSILGLNLQNQNDSIKIISWYISVSLLCRYSLPSKHRSKEWPPQRCLFIVRVVLFHHFINDLRGNQVIAWKARGEVTSMLKHQKIVLWK